MINIITLNNVATFTEQVELNNLKKINFFFGGNGTGKTTLTRVIAKPENFPNCSLEWEANRKKISI